MRKEVLYPGALTDSNRFVLRSFGLSYLINHVRVGIQLGERFAELLKKEPSKFQIVAGPQFGTVVFRAMSSGEAHHTVSPSEEDRNSVTRALLDRLNRSRLFYVTGCKVGSLDVIRFVTSHQGASKESIYQAFAHIMKLTKEIQRGKVREEICSKDVELVQN